MWPSFCESRAIGPTASRLSDRLQRPRGSARTAVGLRNCRLVGTGAWLRSTADCAGPTAASPPKSKNAERSSMRRSAFLIQLPLRLQQMRRSGAEDEANGPPDTRVGGCHLAPFRLSGSVGLFRVGDCLTPGGHWTELTLHTLWRRHHFLPRKMAHCSAMTAIVKRGTRTIYRRHSRRGSFSRRYSHSKP